MRRRAGDIGGHTLRLFQFCLVSHAGKPEGMSPYVPRYALHAAGGLAGRRPPQPLVETGPFAGVAAGGSVEREAGHSAKFSTRFFRESLVTRLRLEAVR